MPIWEAIGLIGLGAFTGTYGILIGAGGGFILVPFLVLLVGLEPRVAVGTSLTVVFVTALSGVIGYARLRAIDYRSGITFALAEIPGSVLGAVAAVKAPEGVLQFSFGGLLLMLSAYMLLKPEVSVSAAASPRSGGRGVTTREITTASGRHYAYSFNLSLASLCTAALGVVSSFFGIGGGLMRVPLLVYGFRVPLLIATATSIFTMALSTGAGVASHAMLGNISGAVLVFTAIGVIAGAQVGIKLAPRLRQGLVIRFLALGLSGAGVSLILHGVGVL
jgi:uncharacterized membrane protein YfcA